MVSCDPWFATLFGYDDSKEIIDKSLSLLIPLVVIPLSHQEDNEDDEVREREREGGREKNWIYFLCIFLYYLTIVTDNFHLSLLLLLLFFSPPLSLFSPSLINNP